MNRPRFIVFLLLILWITPVRALLAQTSSVVNVYVYIDSIIIQGNKKTKDGWVMRELEFKKGDSLLLAEMAKVLERNQLRLMNTSLFTSAKINVNHWDSNNHIRLLIDLNEAWYIFPIPIFELADRNFNVWWDEFDRSLDRTNYGMYLHHFNLTGRADIARLRLQSGYAQAFEGAYSVPVLNKKKTLGFEFVVFYKRQRELAYKTENNKLLFRFDPEEYLSRRRRGRVALMWRPGLFTNHSFALERHENKISEIISKKDNADYFLGGLQVQRHWSFVYKVERDLRDIRPYPVHGWYGVFELRQNGLLPGDDLHLFRASGRVEKYFSFSKKWSLVTKAGGKVSLPRRQIPYYNNQSLGYETDFVRGYEYYVIDGIDFGLVKASLRWQLLNRKFDLGSSMPIKSFKIFPLKLYLAINNDLGYANDPYYADGNPLTNTLLRGTGIGLDVVAYYNKVAQLEWTVNALGQGGFYIHIATGF